MGFLQDKDREAVRERLSDMTGNVKMVYFTQEMECQYCKETGQLLGELTELSDKLSFETFDFVADKDMVDKYNIDKIPAIVLLDKDDTDYGIRMYGIPSGYEFATLLEDILMLSAGDSGLSQASKDALKGLTKDVHFQVFVTPTCPYCPGAVRLAHQMAMESEHVRGDMIEASEFPHLSVKYNVRGVPRTILNEDHALEGMQPEAQVLSEVIRLG